MSLEEGAMKRRSRLRINISLRGLCGGLYLNNGGQMRFICYSSILKSVIVYENEYSGYENETSVIRRDQVVGKKETREREKRAVYHPTLFQETCEIAVMEKVCIWR